MWNVNTIIKASEDLLPELASKLAPGKDIYATDKEKAFIEENSGNKSSLALMIVFTFHINRPEFQ